MKKITESELWEYVSEVGEFEKEHRKYSSFYCTATHRFTQEDVAAFVSEGIDASDFLHVLVTRYGMWDDSNGTDWDNTTYEKIQEYQELVPEVVAPEHYVTKYKTSAFKPVFEE